MSREEVINIMKEHKDKLVKECDHIIDYAEKMEDDPMPEDVPVDTSKME
jgi:Asp-tRNA(Asn)/Glu-tRNA(Gln) amidotransferase C subunit